MDKQEVEVGDQVVFQCGQVPEASRYIFRIKYPDGSIENIPAKSDIIYHSQPVTIESSGDYVAQCQICTDPSSDSCGPWETITH
jgi:hypothetical protein